MAISYKPFDLHPSLNGAFFSIFNDKQIDVAVLIRVSRNVGAEEDDFLGRIASNNLLYYILDCLLRLVLIFHSGTPVGGALGTIRLVSERKENLVFLFFLSKKCLKSQGKRKGGGIWNLDCGMRILE